MHKTFGIPQFIYCRSLKKTIDAVLRKGLTLEVPDWANCTKF